MFLLESFGKTVKYNALHMSSSEGSRLNGLAEEILSSKLSKPFIGSSGLPTPNSQCATAGTAWL